jgi:hypothetical protein
MAHGHAALRAPAQRAAPRRGQQDDSGVRRQGLGSQLKLFPVGRPSVIRPTMAGMCQKETVLSALPHASLPQPLGSIVDLTAILRVA